MTTRCSAAVLLCAGAAAAAAPAAQASTTTPQTPTHRTYQADARLLGGLLGSLTGTTTTTTTTAPVTSTVTNLVDQLLGSNPDGLGLPVQELTNVVATLVDTGVLGTVTDGTLLAEVPVLGDLVTGTVQSVTGGTLDTSLVSGLLSNGVALGALPTTVDQLLSGAGAPTELVESLVGQVVGDILAVGLPTDASALEGVLAQLLGGAALTGTLLEPVAGVLDAIAANEALPAELRVVVGELSATLRSTGTAALPVDVVGQVSDLLLGVSGTANTARPVTDALAALAGLLRARTQPVTGGPSTRVPFRITKAMRVKVRRVSVAKNRRTVRATLACPATALAGCYATSKLRWGGRNAGRAVSSILRPGQVRTISLRLPAKVRRSLLRRGGKVGVRSVTVTQDGRVAAARTERVRRAKRR